MWANEQSPDDPASSRLVRPRPLWSGVVRDPSSSRKIPLDPARFQNSPLPTYGMKLLFSPELGSLQGNRSFTHGFVSGKFDQHRFRFMLLSSLHRRVVNARLFLGQVVNHDDQQDHHQYADHHPNPHPSAHPSVCMVHHKAPFVTLRPAHHWAIQTASGGSSVI